MFDFMLRLILILSSLVFLNVIMIYYFEFWKEEAAKAEILLTDLMYLIGFNSLISFFIFSKYSSILWKLFRLSFIFERDPSIFNFVMFSALDTILGTTFDLDLSSSNDFFLR